MATEYGSIEYWNCRYNEDEDNPFDWLVNYVEVSEILEQLLPTDKSQPILLPGCGNADFSPDLYRIGGYHNQLNFDLSAVVIEQMSKKYHQCHGMKWKVMDVLNLDIKDGSYPVIIDKSLIDTVMCYNDGTNTTMKMSYELYRVLAPGGRMITFSLHAPDEVSLYLHDRKQLISNEGRMTSAPSSIELDWKVSIFRIKSPLWNDHENRRRAVACTLIVCDKPRLGYDSSSIPEIQLKGVLPEEEYKSLELYSRQVNLHAALKLATMKELLRSLDIVLQVVEKEDNVLVLAVKDKYSITTSVTSNSNSTSSPAVDADEQDGGRV